MAGSPGGPGARLPLRHRLLAPEPGWTTEVDVVVVGSGIAGLTTALTARRTTAGRVLLVTVMNPAKDEHNEVYKETARLFDWGF